MKISAISNQNFGAIPKPANVIKTVSKPVYTEPKAKPYKMESLELEDLDLEEFPLDLELSLMSKAYNKVKSKLMERIRVSFTIDSL